MKDGWMGEWLRRVAYLLNRRRLEAVLQDEMETHRALMDDPTRFGRTLQLREQARDVWGWSWLDNALRDLRFAARGLRRTPMFTLVAAVSLGLGFALTASVVSVINAYLIRSFPYAEADRLYHLRYAPPGPWEPRGMTGLDWSSVKDVVEYPIAAEGDSFYLTDDGFTVALRGLRTTRGFVEGLGVSVAAGRRLERQDFIAGSEPVALIGHSLWSERFGADPGAIGRLIRTQPESRPGTAETFRIVGVLEKGFYFGRTSRASVDVLVPHASPVRAYMVRLRDGVPPADAERQLTEAARRAATSPLPADWTGIQLASARERWIGDLRPILFGLTAAVSLVLVIVCANVAVLLLLRSMQRQNEVAVRLALGSAWRHIARMLLAETSLVCAAAFGLGIAFTAVLLRTLSPVIETQLRRPALSAAGITIDTTVLLIVGGVSLLAAVVLSLAPLASAKRGMTNALRQNGRVASEGRTMRRLRRGLVALEVAGSLVLLVACGLMIRSVLTMTSTELGFNPHGLSRSRIMLRSQHYPDAAAFRRLHGRFAQRLSEATGSAVVFSSWPPFVPPPVHLIESDARERDARAGAIEVSAGYFSTFGIGILQGREFTAAEAHDEAPVAIISETLGRRLWPDSSALGKRVRGVEQTPGGSTPGPWRTVVGIAGDVRQAYDDADLSDFYIPTTPDGRYGTFYIRTNRPATLLFETCRRIAAELDRDAVINPTQSVADDNHMLSAISTLTLLLSGFAGMAAFLAILGIYGVTAYAVQQRNKEVAIRVALGASGPSVVGMFLREGVLLLGIGTAVGVAGGVAVSRILRNQVFAVQSFDVPAYAAACALMFAAGLGAALWAARRAAFGRPASALNAS